MSITIFIFCRCSPVCFVGINVIYCSEIQTYPNAYMQIFSLAIMTRNFIYCAKNFMKITWKDIKFGSHTVRKFDPLVRKQWTSGRVYLYYCAGIRSTGQKSLQFSNEVIWNLFVVLGRNVIYCAENYTHIFETNRHLYVILCESLKYKQKLCEFN